MIVDASGSAVGPRPRWVGGALRFLESEAHAAQEAGQEVLVLRVGAHTRRLFGPGSARDFQRALFAEDGEPLALIPEAREAFGTDLAGAFGLVDELLRITPREPSEIVLFGDGTWTGEDPSPRLARLAALGEVLRFEPLPAAPTHRLAVRGLRAPEHLAGGAPFAAVVQVSWCPPPGQPCEGATLHAVLEGMGTRSERNLVLAPGPEAILNPDGSRTFEVRLDWPAQLAGNHRLRVEVHHPDDRVPFDDAASTRLRVADGRTLLLVARDLEVARAEARRWAPFLPGIVFEPIPLDQLPRRLPDAAAVWTLDLGPIDLPQEHLLAAVQSGVGWFATGTGGFLRGFGRGPLAEALPLRLREHPGGPRDVVLAVDGSGSMIGEPFTRVRAAIIELLVGLTSRDDLELRLFQQRLSEPIIRAQGKDAATLQRAIQDLFQATVPGGSTGIPSTVDDLIAVRGTAGRRSLVVFVTDGHSSVGEGHLTSAHRDALEAVDVELVILTTGTAQRPPNRNFLIPLLRPGETIVDAGDLSALTELLVERVRSESMAQAADVAWVPAREFVPGTLAHDWISAAIGSARRSTVGRSGERLDVEIVPGADAIWRIEDEALLAVHEVGLGRVAACGTDPTASPELFDDVFRIAPLLRALTQPPAFDATPRVTCRNGMLEVTNVPPGWPVAVEATVLVSLPGLRSGQPSGLTPSELPLGTTELLLPVDASGEDPRSVRLGDLPARARTQPAGQTWTVRIGPKSRPLLIQAIGSPPVLEHRAASLGAWPKGVQGGRDLATVREGHPAAPWFLGAGWLILTLAGLLPRVSGQGLTGVRR
tara:strand:+ start:36017 stop:38479 length:2463 start_codon:yes stop_codon:yes gene_type:complete